MDLAALLDEREIIGVGLRYARSIDTRDLDGFLSCFTEDAAYGMGALRSRGHAEIGRTIHRASKQFSATQHVTTNFEVALDGDQAAMRSSYVATHVWRAKYDDPYFVMGGFYDDALVRTAHGWRISDRRLANVWITGDPAAIARIGLSDILS